MVIEASIPPNLDLIRQFVNTLDLESRKDELADTRSLGEWLSRHGLVGRSPRPTRRDLADAREVREALRLLLLANNGEEVDTAAAARTLDGAARRARLELRFGGDGTAAVGPATGGVKGALGRIVAIVAEAQRAEEWRRLKACRRHSCQWAFYDQAKNLSRAWCSMKVCGNREKAKKFRERHAH